MNCTCKVDQRRLTPGVFNLKQHLNGSETMVWELDNCVINQGTCDLKDYDAFLTLCVAGEIDEILLTKLQTGDTLQLIWNVGTYATALTGYVKYQIAFRSAQFDTLGVLSNDPAANGVYPLTDTNAAGENRVFRQAESGYTIKWDATNGRWALYKADGTTVVDFQKTPNLEPHCGAWNDIAVSNNEAAAWVSDEAIMYISETIAADQKITGGFPTILRQLWARLSKFGVASVNGKSGVVDLSPVDIGAAEASHGHKISDVTNLQSSLDGKLSTSGGIMKGGETSIRRENVTGRFNLLGGTHYGDGGWLSIFGQDYNDTYEHSRGGGFELGTKSDLRLVGYPDGQLIWGNILSGKHIVRSVDGVNADAAGNVTLNALPKSGGTMTGQIKMSGEGMGIVNAAETSGFTVYQDTNTSEPGTVQIRAGETSKNSYINLYSANHPQSSGRIVLYARNSDDLTTLTVDPSGVALINNKYVLTDSFNLPSNQGQISITAGVSGSTGASIRLYSSHGNDFVGQFHITAALNGRTYSLIGDSTGGLKWNGKSIIPKSYAPDWSAKVSKLLSTTYTAESDGWIIYCGKSVSSNSTRLEVFINEEKIVSDYHDGDNDGANAYIPIANGDTYKLTDTAGLVYFYFVPIKG